MENLPHFNDEQLNYFRDTRFLLTKRKILAQVEQLLASTEKQLVKRIQEAKKDPVPNNCLTKAGKISRGENYHGLPFMVLDYPRLFSKKEIFAFRTMCWWGNFFSCTLHLQGTVLKQFRPALKESLSSGSHPPADLFLCVNETPWEYHYEQDNYQLLNKMEDKMIHNLIEQDFVKISRKMELDQYENLPQFATNCFAAFMTLLHNP